MEIRAKSLFLVSNHDINRISERAMMRLSGALKNETEVITEQIAQKIKEQQSKGRAYPSRKNPGQFHFASLPGYPPNEDTGRLRRGIYTKKQGAGNALNFVFGIRARGEDGQDYASRLEYGDPARRLEPRPFFSSTVLERIRSAGFKKRFNQVHYLIKNEIQGLMVKKYAGKGKKIA